MSFQTKKSKLTSLISNVDSQMHSTAEPIPKGNIYPIWSIVGMRGTGKSTLIIGSLKHVYKKFFDLIFLLSPTAKMDTKFKKLVKELEGDGQYFATCNDENMGIILDAIIDFNANWDEKEEGRKPHHLIILDDCISSLPRGGEKDNNVLKLFANNRHIRTNVIITSQKFNKLPTLLRQNTNIWSLFHTDNNLERKTIGQDLFSNHEFFEKIFEFATLGDQYDFLHMTNLCRPMAYFKRFDRIILPE